MIMKMDCLMRLASLRAPVQKDVDGARCGKPSCEQGQTLAASMRSCRCEDFFAKPGRLPLDWFHTVVGAWGWGMDQIAQHQLLVRDQAALIDKHTSSFIHGMLRDVLDWRYEVLRALDGLQSTPDASFDVRHVPQSDRFACPLSAVYAKVSPGGAIPCSLL